MSLKLLPAALLALMAVQACDGTPFGQQLSDSFDGSSSESSSGNPPPSVQSKVESVKEEPIERVSVNEASGKDNPVKNDSIEEVSVNEDSGKEATGKAGAAESETIRIEATPQSSTSARRLPYRITLRLFSADPAAPAEGVTKALRKAGIGFEVETIEKSSMAQPSALMDERATPLP